MKDSVRDYQIVRDRSGYYRAMGGTYVLQPEFEETSVAQDMTYSEACKLAAELYEVEEVMSS